MAKHLRRLRHVPTPTVSVSVSVHGTPASFQHFRPPPPPLDAGAKTLLPLLNIDRVVHVQRANALTEVAVAAAARRDRRFTVGVASSDDHFALRPRAEGRDLKRKSALGKLQSDGALMKLAALTPQQLAGPRRSRIDSIQYRTRPPKQLTPPLTSTEQLMRGSVMHPIAAGLPRKFHKPQQSEWGKVRGGVAGSSKGHAFPQLMELAQRDRHPRSVIAQEALRANPCAHSVNAAEEMSLAGRVVARTARARYDEVQARPGSVGAPHRLRRSVGDVSTQRPFFVRPTLAPRRVHRGEVKP